MTKQETGRSMVEMLGVLAIIGVLSIGGIAGYTVAMNRYKANEILDMSSKVAVLGMAQGGATMDTDLGISDIHGITDIEADANGMVKITGKVSEGVANAMESIAGTKLGTTGTATDGEVNADWYFDPDRTGTTDPAASEFKGKSNQNNGG